jgi:sugar phosphate permease
LVDALRIKELNLLILSYLFRQAHNTFIRENSFYVATDSIMGIYYYSGAIGGVILTGIASDLWLTNKRFLMIFLLNSLLLVWDIYLFIAASN